MNKIIKYFWTTFTLVTFLQSTCGLELDDAVVPISGKETLTAKFCNESGFITVFSGLAKSIDIVQYDALWNCKELQDICLSFNRIAVLHPNTFKFNIKATFLDLRCNKISLLSNQLFEPLKNLETLRMSGNPLKSIQPVLTSTLNNLMYLAIGNMELNELDVKILLDLLPKLKEIWFDHNLIECSVHESIKADLMKNNVSYMKDEYGCLPLKKTCLSKDDVKTLRLNQEIKAINQTVVDIQNKLSTLTKIANMGPENF